MSVHGDDLGDFVYQLRDLEKKYTAELEDVEAELKNVEKKARPAPKSGQTWTGSGRPGYIRKTGVWQDV